MLLNTWELNNKKKKIQRDILKGIAFDWYHFRPLLNPAGQSF
jgi:hypothetical protein